MADSSQTIWKSWESTFARLLVAVQSSSWCAVVDLHFGLVKAWSEVWEAAPSFCLQPYYSVKKRVNLCQVVMTYWPETATKTTIITCHQNNQVLVCHTHSHKMHFRTINCSCILCTHMVWMRVRNSIQIEGGGFANLRRKKNGGGGALYCWKKRSHFNSAAECLTSFLFVCFLVLAGHPA